MRSAPCFKTMATLRLYDQELKRCLKEVLNTDLSDLAWDQSSLPVKQGGLGIRKASDLALPAFLSSAYSATPGVNALVPEAISSAPNQYIQEALETWKGPGLDETLVSVSISRISRSKFLVSVSSRSRKIILQNSGSRLGLEKRLFESSRVVSILGVFCFIFETFFLFNQSE